MLWFWTHVIRECVLCPLWLLKRFPNASWGVENWERKDEFHFWSLCNNVCNTNKLRFLFLIFLLLCVWHARGSQRTTLERVLSFHFYAGSKSRSACQSAGHWNLVSRLACPVLVFGIWILLSVLPVSCISNQIPCIFKTFFCFALFFAFDDSDADNLQQSWAVSWSYSSKDISNSESGGCLEKSCLYLCWGERTMGVGE